MKKLLGSILVIAALSSCKKDSDTSPPTISSVTINGVSNAEHSLSSGGSFTLRVIVNDNEELNQLKIDIHSADDGHLHELSGEENRGSAWEVFEIVNLSGKSMEVIRNFSIPADQQGEWHQSLSPLLFSGLNWQRMQGLQESSHLNCLRPEEHRLQLHLQQTPF
jgi:hypothetical protein